MSVVASYLTVSNAVPLASMYLSLAVIGLLIYVNVIHLSHKK